MDKQEINKLIIDNQNLAYYMLHKYKNKVSSIIDEEDLKSICLLGLVKSANTFEVDKNVKFSSYACKVIHNDILLAIRKNSKHSKVYSIDGMMTENLTYIEVIKDELDLEQSYMENTQLEIMHRFIEELPDNLKTIVQYKLEGKTQNEIAQEMNISQPQVSRLYAQALNILRIKFEREE